MSPAPFTRYGTRRSQFVRLWNVLVLLRQGPRTLRSLAEELGCCERTIRRDIQVLETVPFPVVYDNGYWGVLTVAAWPAREATPVRELPVDA